MTIEAIVPPPDELQRRAWECAWQLHENFQGRLRWSERLRSLVIYQKDPIDLTWNDMGTAFRLYRRVHAEN